MFNQLRVVFNNRIIGRDLYIETLNTPEKISYEIHHRDGRKTFGTKIK